jgi:hypothetical protein
MQDRPTADELTEAVSQFIQAELAPTIADPRLRFRALIAANLMAIVTRELRAGDAPLREEWQALAALLGGREAAPADAAGLRDQIDALGRELRARIRAGDADDGPWAEAAGAFAEASVIARLKIANPRFLERVAAER